MVDETARYSMTGVKLINEPHGGWRAEATDGRRLAILQEGPVDLAEIGKTMLATLEEPGPEIESAIVPVEPLKQAFRLCKKDNSRILVRLSQGEAVIVSGNGTVLTRTPYVEGRFPDVNQVVPTSLPIITLHVNGEYLASLVTLIAKVLKAEGEEPSMTICFYGKNGVVDDTRPVGVAARTAGGLFVDGLIMPINRPSTVEIDEPATVEEVIQEAAAEIANCEAVEKFVEEVA